MPKLWWSWKAHIFPNQRLVPPYQEHELGHGGNTYTRKTINGYRSGLRVFPVSVRQHTDASDPCCYAVICALFPGCISINHWFNQYYWALILCRHSGVAKCSPHLIYVKTEVQRSEPTCPEALGGSPLPGTEMQGETTDEVLPSWSLHSFLFYICVHYMIIHSFSTFISDFKAYKSACKSAGSIEISNVVIMN